MRLSRDSLLSDITSLKSQLKEQNQRLITLNKEKANFDAKKNALSALGKVGEQMKIEFGNEQIALNQLREDVKEIKTEVSSS